MTRRTPLITLFVLALLAAACSGSSTDTTNQVSIEFAPVAIEGDALPPLGETASDAGLVAPSFTAQSTHSASPTTINVDDGTVRMIGFFAHWCPHCQREVPRVVEYLDSKGTPDGVEILAVSTGVDEGSPNYPPSEWFDREEWPTEVYVDSEAREIASAYGLSGFPYWVIVSGDGSVMQRISGELTESQLDSLVQFAATQAG